METTLKPIYSIVARELALGIPLADICEARSLSLASMQRIVRGALFQEEVRRFQAEVDRELIESASADPVLQKLRALSYRAVGALATEMENYDTEAGGSATTRISAADKILNKAGYAGKQDHSSQTNVIIMLTESKLNAVKQAELTTAEQLKHIPDCVDGHLVKAV